jgi:hypothetical protein
MNETAYVYDEQGYFLGETQVQESPLEPGVWLMPGACTMTAPPKCDGGETARWNGDMWIVEQIVVPEPAPAPTIEDVKAQALQSVEGTLYGILKKGFVYGTDIIQADSIAQQNATGFLTAINAGATIPFPIEWRTFANTFIFIPDADTFKVFASLMLSFVQQAFHDSWNAKDNIRSALTIDDVSSILSAYSAKLD